MGARCRVTAPAPGPGPGLRGGSSGAPDEAWGRCAGACVAARARSPRSRPQLWALPAAAGGGGVTDCGLPPFCPHQRGRGWGGGGAASPPGAGKEALGRQGAPGTGTCPDSLSPQRLPSSLGSGVRGHPRDCILTQRTWRSASPPQQPLICFLSVEISFYFLELHISGIIIYIYS